MTHRVITPVLAALGFLLADTGFPQQVYSPIGRKTTSTVKIEGCKGQAGCIAVPVDIGGTSVSATTTCRATAAAPTYVEGTDDPVSCDLAGGVRTTSAGGGGGGLTDTQLRASPVPVSGPLTDAQLRASAVPVSNASLPLPVGASTAAKQDTGNTSLSSIDGKDFATQTTLALIKAKTDNIDVALSTRTKPADVQSVSASSLPLPAGASTEATLALIKAKTDNLDALLSTRTKPADTQLVSLPDVTTSGSITAQTPCPGAGCVSVVLGGSKSSAGVTITGTWTGTLKFQGSFDGTNFFDLSSFGLLSGLNFQTTTGNGNFSFQVGGMQSILVNASLAAWTGTATIAWRATAGTNGFSFSNVRVQDPSSGGPVMAVKAGSTLPAASDTAAVVTLRDAATAQGSKTNNNAAPGATNFGVLPFLANAAVPSWTEGNLVTGSVDLNGGQRVVERPPVVTGAYRAHVTTGGYAGVAADGTLISFRYTGTGLCVVTRVRAFVTTQTAATVAGRIDRGLYVVRSFTAADSGGTAITLTAPFGKLRTSHATTGLGNLMVLSAGALTKGTGTQDANPVGVMAKQGTATEPVGLTLPAPGTDADLFQYSAGQNYPIVLAQNEGLRISILTAMPTTLAQVTAATFEWYELASSTNF